MRHREKNIHVRSVELGVGLLLLRNEDYWSGRRQRRHSTLKLSFSNTNGDKRKFLVIDGGKSRFVLEYDKLIIFSRAA